MQPVASHPEDGFRSVTENAPEGIIVAQGFDVPCRYVNRRACELSGYTLPELMDIQPSQLLEPGECARIEQHLEMQSRDKNNPEAFETTLLCKGGQVLPIEITGSPVVWQGTASVLIKFRDITRNKKLEADLGEQIQERTASWRMAVETLEAKQRELTVRRQELDRINKELVKANTALSVLARNIDRRRDELEKKITQIVSKRIIPLINELRFDNLPLKTQAKIDVLTTLLSDLTSEGKAHDVIVSLSSAELRVAVMIKNGFTSDQIANALHTSPHTVKTHRRRIRRKLGILNSNVNLTSYLRFKLGKDLPSHLKDDEFTTQ